MKNCDCARPSFRTTTFSTPTDEDIKEHSRHSNRHLRYVGVRKKTCVVSADAREKE